MEPLIRLRLLAAQLKQHELQHLIQSVIESYTADQILSFIFNHFVLRYQQTKEVDSDATQMIQMISDVLNTRKKTQSKANQKRTVSATIKIDSIPSDMIGECASFLQVIDYISFSKCNRKTYIGCNSPVTLQEFRLTKGRIECDLNHFPLLKHLAFSIKIFNKYMKMHPMQRILRNVCTLTADGDGLDGTFYRRRCHRSDVMTKIHVPNIRHLTCSDFGVFYSGLAAPLTAQERVLHYNSQSFCSFLSSFENLDYLCLRKVFLTNDLDLKSIPNMLRKLRSLSVKHPVNEPVLLLRNKLLDLYSQQMVSIEYDESTMDLDVSSFPQLKAVRATDPNMDSLLNIVGNASYLEYLSCKIPLTSSRSSMNQIKCVIETIFCKCVHCDRIGIIADNVQITQIMKWVESALRDRNNKIQKEVTLSFSVLSQPNTEQIDEMMLSLSKLINTLETQMNDFMLKMSFSSQSPKAWLALDKNMDQYKKKYLVYIYDDFHAVIISNKTCKIKGYLPLPKYY